jgi:hypothetical protein
LTSRVSPPLARGERDRARACFRKTNEQSPLAFPNYFWVRAIRKRVPAGDDDCFWPP